MPLLASIKSHPLFQKYRCALVAFALVFMVFPDVFLASGSLSIADQMRWDGERSPLGIYPSITKRYKGILDPGGAWWQSEPKVGFMKHVFESGESPYWNPYSASGTLGPETLTDNKFSPITLMSAWFGGSSLAISFSILFFLWLGCYSLIRTCRCVLELPMIAGIAAAMAYMFNGFQASGLANNYTQPYLLFPLALYALLSFVKHGGIGRFVAAYIALALVMMVTFIPTMALGVMSITLLGLGYAWHLPLKKRWWRMGAICLIPFCALLMVAFIYIPIVDALSITRDSEAYAKRVFYPATVNGLLSLFSPEHLWQSYRYNLQIFGEPSYPLFSGNTVFHIGVVGGLLALLSWQNNASKPLLLAAWVLFAAMMLRIFGAPVFEYDYWKFSSYRNTAILNIIILFALAAWCKKKISDLKGWLPLVVLILCIGFFDINFYNKAINTIPIIGNFGEQYSWIVLMICLPICIAYGMAAIMRGASLQPLARAYIACIGLLFACLVVMHPLKDYHTENLLPVAVFFGVLAGLYWVYKNAQNPAPRFPLPLMLLAFLFMEYSLYVPHLHPIRADPYTSPPEYISYIQQRIGNQRIINLGNKGIAGEVAAAFQIPDVAGMTMNAPSNYVDFFKNDFLPEAYNFNDFPGFIGATDSGLLDVNLVNFLGVRYVLAPNDWSVFDGMLKHHGFTIAHETVGKKVAGIRIYENPAVWPRAFVTTVPVQSLTIEAIKNHTVKRGNITPATIKTYGHTHLSIDVDAPKAGMLVLTDNWYPYWHASVNGQDVAVEKIFKTFRGVAVPKGKSKVEFIYDNPAVNLGVRISAIFAAISFLLAGFGIFQHYRKRSTASQKSVSGLVP